MNHERIELDVNGIQANLATCVHEGRGAPLLLLHGFGSTKEDYADLAHYPRCRGHRIVTYDAPGHGESECRNLSALSIPFLQATAERLIERFRLRCFHLAGHSMGGLTALMIAGSRPDAVISFTNIEGNLTPEDCFLSGQIHAYPSANADDFFSAFIQRLERSSGLSEPIYARGLRAKVRPGAIVPIFRSMVDLSNHGNLLEKFIRLPCPRMFVHGSKNRSLSYLGKLKQCGVRLAEIPHSGHFPMYANPVALWARISAFIEQAEKDRNRDRT